MSKIKVDIYLLADATGSMGAALSDVKKNMKTASEVLRDENDWDVGVGVSWYRDTVDGDRDIFDNVLGITTDFNKLDSALEQIRATGGGDTLEAQMYALYRLARQERISLWREGAFRFITWYGDEGGHNPLVYRGINYTQDKAIKELKTKDIIAMAFNTRTNESGINYQNQATAITDQTGGDYLSSVNQNEIIRVMYDTIQRHLEDLI